MKPRRRFLASSVGALLMTQAWTTWSQGRYPTKPIRFIVPFPAGGVTDLAARLIGQSLGIGLGQPVILEYKPGADGLIAGEVVARSSPDGYTFLFASATGMSYAPAAHKVMPYNPITDFTPISRIGTFGFFVYVHKDVPVKTLAELISYVRANPGKINYGSSTATGILTIAQFAQSAKLDMIHVPYKGDAPMFLDIIAGRIQLMFAAGAALLQAQEGKLRVLATLMPNRSPLVPDVPTLVESGFSGITITPWAGLFGPGQMPREIVDRVSSEVAAALARPELREQLGKLALDCQSSGPEELASFVKDQLGIWAKAAKDAGVALE